MSYTRSAFSSYTPHKHLPHFLHDHATNPHHTKSTSQPTQIHTQANHQNPHRPTQPSQNPRRHSPQQDRRTTKRRYHSSTPNQNRTLTQLPSSLRSQNTSHPKYNLLTQTHNPTKTSHNQMQHTTKSSHHSRQHQSRLQTRRQRLTHTQHANSTNLPLPTAHALFPQQTRTPPTTTKQRLPSTSQQSPQLLHKHSKRTTIRTRRLYRLNHQPQQQQSRQPLRRPHQRLHLNHRMLRQPQLTTKHTNRQPHTNHQQHNQTQTQQLPSSPRHQITNQEQFPSRNSTQSNSTNSTNPPQKHQQPKILNSMPRLLHRRPLRPRPTLHSNNPPTLTNRHKTMPHKHHHTLGPY